LGRISSVRVGHGERRDEEGKTMKAEKEMWAKLQTSTKKEVPRLRPQADQSRQVSRSVGKYKSVAKITTKTREMDKEQKAKRVAAGVGTNIADKRAKYRRG
jgi:hypothetical protein